MLEQPLHIDMFSGLGGASEAFIQSKNWDVIRFDGFTKGEDTRVGYNWRHNGIEHMQILAIDKNKKKFYILIKPDKKKYF